MRIPNFWPPTADIYFEGEFLTKARHVGGAYEANFPQPHRDELLELIRHKKLWREESNDANKRFGPGGELIGIDISNVRFDLTRVPSDHSCPECTENADFTVITPPEGDS